MEDMMKQFTLLKLWTLKFNRNFVLCCHVSDFETIAYLHIWAFEPLSPVRKAPAS